LTEQATEKQSDDREGEQGKQHAAPSAQRFTPSW
jgi:hypothetical protein